MIHHVTHAENRQPDSVAKEHEPRGVRSVFKFLTNKAPLRPLQRIGLLLLNGIPLLALIFFFGRVISMFKDAPIAALCLLVPILLLWTLITLAAGRLVWVALSAPSQRDDNGSANR